MAKRTISAKELLDDIRAGMDDLALMDKYRLKPEGLQTVYKKLSNAGVMKSNDLNDRKLSDEPVEAVFKCPACGKPQTKMTAECPDCGVILSKFSKPTYGDFTGNLEGATGRPHFLVQHKGMLALVALVFFLVSIFGFFYWMKVQSDKKRQAELVQLEKIEREKRLKEEAEVRKREAVLRQEELRLKREDQRVEREIAKQQQEQDRESMRKTTEVQRTVAPSIYEPITKVMMSISTQMSTGNMSIVVLRKKSEEFVDRLAELQFSSQANPVIVAKLEEAAQFLAEASSKSSIIWSAQALNGFLKASTEAAKLIAQDPHKNH